MSIDRTQAASVEAQAGDSGVEIKLEAVGTIKGLIVDAEGHPVPMRGLITATSQSAGWRTWGTIVDESGHFQLMLMPRLTYDLSVVTDNNMYGLSRSVRLEDNARIDVAISVGKESELHLLYTGPERDVACRIRRDQCTVQCASLERGKIATVIVPAGRLEVETRSGDTIEYREIVMQQQSEASLIFP